MAHLFVDISAHGFGHLAALWARPERLPPPVPGGAAEAAAWLAAQLRA